MASSSSTTGRYLPKTERDELRTVFLVRHDRKKIVAGIQSDTSKHNWAANNSSDERTYELIAEMIILFGETVENEAASCDFEVAGTDQDFAATMDRLVETWR